MQLRVGLLAALIAFAAAALYEHEDSASVFSWLHSILTDMNVAVAAGSLAKRMQTMLVKAGHPHVPTVSPGGVEQV